MKIFFVVFLVAGMRKKNDVEKKEKKKKGSGKSWIGLLPNSQARSRYNRLYRDIAGHMHVGGVHGQPGHDHSMATTLPGGLRYGRPVRRASGAGPQGPDR